MNVIIKPSKLTGDVIIPPSKSLSHRAIIAASLAKGKSTITNVLFSKDILATIDAMEACGAKITKYEDSLEIYGIEKVIRNKSIIDANESGSTIRFMIPIALTNNEPITFVGHNNLVNRPLDVFYEIFDNQNIEYKREDNKYLPLYVNGGLKPGKYNIRGDISSQFITGLLYALPLLNGDSEIVITTNLESKGYIDLTLDILNMYGIEIINDNYERFIIKGNQSYKPHDYEIEGDYSQSAFFLVADMLGANINLLAMREDSYQGDKKIIDDIKSFGGNVSFDNKILKAEGMPKGCTIDFSQSPDLGPALTVLAALSDGHSSFINAKRLRIKECDRITCMADELNKIGCIVKENPDGMEIDGVKDINPIEFDSHNDHRVAMALSMICLVSKKEFKILNAECVSKSYPNYWNVFESLGGIISYED